MKDLAVFCVLQSFSEFQSTWYTRAVRPRKVDQKAWCNSATRCISNCTLRFRKPTTASEKSKTKPNSPRWNERYPFSSSPSIIQPYSAALPSILNCCYNVQEEYSTTYFRCVTAVSCSPEAFAGTGTLAQGQVHSVTVARWNPSIAVSTKAPRLASHFDIARVFHSGSVFPCYPRTRHAQALTHPTTRATWMTRRRDTTRYTAARGTNGEQPRDPTTNPGSEDLRCLHGLSTVDISFQVSKHASENERPLLFSIR